MLSDIRKLKHRHEHAWVARVDQISTHRKKKTTNTQPSICLQKQDSAMLVSKTMINTF